ncbi:MAG: helix-turn-helix domain-containing protein [Planctomycetes bacterium]|nr:helix-turn-helix domain-containing protein [Planctomycetota bacterium]
MSGIGSSMRQQLRSSVKSRYRISRESGIAQSQISRFLKGESTITIDTADRLADAMGFRIRLVKQSERRKGTGSHGTQAEK